MSTNSGSRDLTWIVAGALGLLIAVFAILYSRGDRDPVAQIALKEKRVALLNSMRVSLAAASEAQNSAVMSTREQDLKTFTDEARLATADLERDRIELAGLLKEHPVPRESELMDRVTGSLHEFQQIEEQLLDLASQSSNRKAFDLAFGPAMKLLKEMDDPLSRILADGKELSADDRLRVTQLAGEIRVGILRMQVLLLPHIAEASDQKMDEFEQQLSAINQKIRADLAALKGLLPESSKTQIETMTSGYAEFETLKSEILNLSRQNTDLRATAIALKEKRKAMLACQDALIALEQAIRAEPITSTIPSGRSQK